MSGNEKGTRWTFEIVFWGILLLGSLLYMSYAIFPRADRLHEQEDQVKAARREISTLEGELAGARECVSALKGDEPSPDVIERELRNRLGYKKEGEVRISLTDE